MTSPIFSPSLAAAVRESASAKKPLFVYLCSPQDSPQDSAVEQLIPKTARDKFVLLKLVSDTKSFASFEHDFGEMSIPSFCVVEGSEVVDIYTEFEGKFDDELSDFAARLESIAESYEASPESTSAEENTHSEAATEQKSSVKEYQQKMQVFNKEKKEEIKRLRKLLEFDQKERDSQKAYESRVNDDARQAPKASSSLETCTLSIRLLDGSVILHSFGKDDTLDVVRKWLDVESGVEVVPPIALPSFAKPSSVDPVRYVFHSPAPPRETYTDTQELESLWSLNLCPRAVVVLKPIYSDVEEAASATDNMRKMRNSAISAIGAGIGKVGNALYSFFDYSVADIPEEDEDAEDFLDQPIEVIPRASSPIFSRAISSSRVQTISKDDVGVVVTKE